MTVFEFFNELLRGKGNCYYAVKNDPERYQAFLTYAATRSTAYDMQCEGTRAGYIYELLTLTGDTVPYLTAAIRAFHDASPLYRNTSPAPSDEEEPDFSRNLSPTDDDFHFLAELLAHFAKDKNSEALAALVKEYDALFCYLRDLSERPDLFFHERDVFEALAITLCEFNLCDRIAAIRDAGKLLFENPIYTHYDFDQFHDLVAHHHRKTLKTMADDSAIFAYLKAYYPDFCSDPNNHAKAESEEDMEDLILDIMPPPGPLENEKYYHAPLHSPLAEQTSSPTGLMVMVETYNDPDKVEDALLALSKMRHPKVREWALAGLKEDPERYLPIVIKNYEDEDRAILLDALKTLSVDYQNDGAWHAIHLTLLLMASNGLTPPHEALLLIYQTTFCPNCRYKAIKQLYEQKMLTTEILSEALYDCHERTRELVRSILSE